MRQLVLATSIVSLPFASHASLDALPESGGIVRVPPGNYELTQP